MARRPDPAPRSASLDTETDPRQVVANVYPPAAKLSQLWQVPLLVVSLGLFAVAAYMVVSPAPAWSVDRKLELADRLVEVGRHGDALDQLNDLLVNRRLDPAEAAPVHLQVARTLSLAQAEMGLDVPANHRRIVEQVDEAAGKGATLTAEDLERRALAKQALGLDAEAADDLRAAIVADEHRGPALRKKLVKHLLDRGEHEAALPEIDAYLQTPQLDVSERAWALGERAEVLLAGGDVAAAHATLEEAKNLSGDPSVRGIVRLKLGQTAHTLGDPQKAEQELRVARQQLGTGHELDADACLLLGEIAQDRGDHAEAVSFFDVILSDHPGSEHVWPALVRRGVSHANLGDPAKALGDLDRAVAHSKARPSKRELRTLAADALVTAQGLAADQAATRPVLEMLALESDLHEAAGAGLPPADYYGRLAVALEDAAAARADEARATADPAERMGLGQEVRRLQVNAGNAHLTFARVADVTADARAIESVRQAVELFEDAGAIDAAAEALELYAVERPNDPATPDALLRLGQLYQSTGQYEKAAKTLRRNRELYPKAMAAANSTVPLARSLIAWGPDHHDEAQTLLEGMLADDPLLTPESEAYRQALFELGGLYHRRAMFPEAITKLDEFLQRYPEDERVSRILYFKADSYRRHAAAMFEQLKADEAENADDATLARRRRDVEDGITELLKESSDLYRRVLRAYVDRPPVEDADRRLEKLSHFYLADNLFDLGRFRDAIELYNTAAYRYQDDPAALAAYVQIVNAHLRLGEEDEARTVNERAKWLLERMPETAFDETNTTLSRQQWARWFDWADQSGMWAEGS